MNVNFIGQIAQFGGYLLTVHHLCSKYFSFAT